MLQVLQSSSIIWSTWCRIWIYNFERRDIFIYQFWANEGDQANVITLYWCFFFKQYYWKESPNHAISFRVMYCWSFTSNLSLDLLVVEIWISNFELEFSMSTERLEYIGIKLTIWSDIWGRAVILGRHLVLWSIWDLTVTSKICNWPCWIGFVMRNNQRRPDGVE